MSTKPERIDLSRLDALVKLKGEEDALRALLGKATARRDAELAVYARVSADYLARIATIADQAQAERARAREFLGTLEQLHETARQVLDRARAQLQECEFRHQIGEFTPEQFAACRQAAQQSVAEGEAEFHRIRNLRQGYTELLSDAPGSSAPAGASDLGASSRSASIAAPVARVAETPEALPAAPRPPAPLPPAPPPVQVSDPTPAAPAPVDATMFMAPSTPVAPPAPDEDDAVSAAGFGTVAIAAALLTELQEGHTGTQHRIGRLTTIGRTADNQIVIPLQDVSRRHAEITRMANGYVLKDLNSPNGTFVNGGRIREHVLENGDRVTIGGSAFVFEKP